MKVIIYKWNSELKTYELFKDISIDFRESIPGEYCNDGIVIRDDSVQCFFTEVQK